MTFLMTFLYPNPVLQMKHSFWRINLYVICRSCNRCKPYVQRWSFLADWKRLMLQKGFSHSFWCTRDTWSFFVSNSVCFWRKGKCFTLLSQLATFFFQAAIIFATNFCELVHRKTFVLPTDCCFWKKTYKLKLKEDEIIGGKKESYFRRLFGLLHGKQEISKVLYSFFVWSMKSVERVSQSSSFKWKQSSSSEKKHY